MQYSLHISGNRGYDSNRVSFLVPGRKKRMFIKSPHYRLYFITIICKTIYKTNISRSHPFFFGTQWRRSHFFTPFRSFVSSHLLRDSLCTALQTERLWIWSTGLSTQLTPSSRREAWVLGNLTALTEHSQLAIRWTRGRGGESFV